MLSILTFVATIPHQELSTRRVQINCPIEHTPRLSFDLGTRFVEKIGHDLVGIDLSAEKLVGFDVSTCWQILILSRDQKSIKRLC